MGNTSPDCILNFGKRRLHVRKKTSIMFLNMQKCCFSAYSFPGNGRPAAKEFRGRSG